MGEQVVDAKQAKRQGVICTTADMPCAAFGATSYPASTDDGFAVRSPHVRERGDEATTAHVPRPIQAAPTMVITIRDKNLKTPYIDELMRSKGLDEQAIAKIRSDVRRYIDSFVKDKGVDLDEGSYVLLTNMIIHLIEESSKDE